MTNKDRILEISKKLGLSHISSNLSCLPILEEIYEKKKPGDIVILDNAHAHLAHLVVKESKEWDEPMANAMIQQYGIHCDRKAGCDASGGSLGHGLGIGIGCAIANPDKQVYVVVSDGSMMEGSNWEALRITSKMQLENIYIYCNFNGYTAVDEIDTNDLFFYKIRSFAPDLKISYFDTDNGEGFSGVQGHYKKL